MKRNLSPRIWEKAPIKRCTLNKCHGACCLHGVWLDVMERQDLLDHTALIIPWMPEPYQDPQKWFENEIESDEHSLSGSVVHSTVVADDEHYGGTVCIFSMPDRKCALQVAGESAGFHPWRFKPFYCILHPLDIDEKGRITLDETELLVNEPASCLQPCQEEVPIFTVFEEELRYLLGDLSYEHLCEDNDIST